VTSQPQQPSGPPIPPLAQMIYGLFRAQAVCVAARLAIADLLADGSKPADALARSAGADPAALSRLLRFLSSEGVFCQNADGRWELNEAAQTLRSGVPGSVRPMALFYGSSAIWSAWGNLLASVANATTGFEAAHGLPLFPYLEDHPDDAAIFNDFMTSMVSRRTPASGYDYTGTRTVVDIGGGHGATIIDVLQTHPGLRGVLFDLPEVVTGAAPAINAAGQKDRCELVGGSFFDAVPSGGDAYILSNILHDWNDADCVRILRSCREAMRLGSKLVIVELIVPSEPNGPSFAKFVDLQMMAVTGGVQRTLEEFQRLLDATGFGQARVLPPGLIEAVAV